VKIFGSRIGFGVEHAKPVGHGLCSCKMVVADRLAQRPRPTVHHEPEAAIFVRLNFNEVVAAAERCEFDRTFGPTDRFEAAVAERIARHIPGLRNDRSAIAPPSGHSPA
jgi:hypothetical protein